MPSPWTVYLYRNCSTCRDAVQWLKEHEVPYAEKPIYEQPPTLLELRAMLAAHGGERRKLFNTSGLVYKERNLKETLPTLTDDEALALLAKEGRLVKRPFVLGTGVALLGFKPEVWEKALRQH